MCSNCDCDPLVAQTGDTLKLCEAAPVKPCRRCGGEPFIILDKVHVECKQCFLESCRKKFRSTIGKSKLVRNRDPVLVAYSEGPSSKALVDLLDFSMGTENCREQKFRPSLLHIDTQIILAQNSMEDTVKRAENLFELLHKTSQDYPAWPIYWTTIENATTDDRKDLPLFKRFTADDDYHAIKSSPMLNHDQTADDLLRQMTDLELTDRHKMLEDIRGKLINRVAVEINSEIEESENRIKYVFVANSATQLANNLLVDVILGRGSTIRSTVNFCDTRHPIPVLRPMREFSKKEIAFYLRARNIETSIMPNLLTFADRKASIQTVTEAFLSKLYVDYPSTYNTLLRTGNKMQN